MIKKLGVALASLALCLVAAETSYRASKFLDQRLRYRRGGTFDIYAIGGSVATAAPFSSPVAFPNIVRMMFDGTIGGRPVVVHDISSPGNTAVSDFFYLRRALSYRRRGAPGLVLIYGGNTQPAELRRWPALFEFFRRLQAGAAGRSLLVTDGVLALERALRIGADPLPAYEEAVRGMIDESRKAGLTPMLATVAIDASGFEPLEPAARELREALKEGLELERRREYARAEKLYVRLQEGRPQARRFLQHRVCRCLEAAGQYARALACYDENVGIDAGRSAPGPRNEALRRVSRELTVPLIDTVEIFRKRSPHGILSNGLFYDEGHPNTIGQIAIAEAFAAEAARAFGEPVRRRFSAPEEVFSAAAYPPSWKACGLVGAGFQALRGTEDLAYAAQRVGFAAECFDQALALEPASSEAGLGAALTAAAEDAGGVMPPTGFFRLTTEAVHGGVTCLRACLTVAPEQARALLKSAGAPEALSERWLKSPPAACRD